jgi:spermidine synthase
MAVVNGWFEEKEQMWPGQRFSLKLAEPKAGGAPPRLLHEETSHFSLAGGIEGGQLIQVFDSATYGRVLALDGVIQLSERDEFAYQEMIVHLPMFAHANPERVLIVGGGDGGVLREVLRHKGVQRAVMCEIDQVRAAGRQGACARTARANRTRALVRLSLASSPRAADAQPPCLPRTRAPARPRRPPRHPPLPRPAQKVCEVGKRFFGSTLSVEFADPSSAEPAKRTRDPRALLHYEDASAYMAQHKGEFDVIIVDSSDPVGPAAMLYSSKFYSDMHAALRPGGIVCTQGECQFLHEKLIADVMRDARALYPVVDYAFSTVPTYPSGQIGFIIAQKAGGAGGDLRVAKRAVPADMAAALRYYSAAIHGAAFVLPAFMDKLLRGSRQPQAAAAAPAANAGPTIDARAAVVLAVAVGAAAFFFGKQRR